MLISAIIGDEFYYIFYLTSLFLLVMIVSNYYEIYKKNNFTNTKVLIGAFSLALSQLIFILSKVEFLLFWQVQSDLLVM